MEREKVNGGALSKIFCEEAMDGGDGGSHTTRKPKYSRFAQQELPAWRPMLTPGLVIAVYIAIGAIFIAIGLVTLSASKSVVELVQRYDDECIPTSFKKNESAYIQNPETNKTCPMTITVKKRMKAPIFIYYRLDNFHQNHHRYAKSRSDRQLRSSKYKDEVTHCVPEASLPNHEPIVPCGLMAWSFFNDTFQLSMKDKSIYVDKKGIAWSSETKYKFGSDVFPQNFQSGELIGGGNLSTTLPLNQQEDFIVWMRTAALPTFRKLYGKINTSLEANENISVIIENNYNTYSFGGKKKLVLSTTSWIGGRNDFLGIAYLTVGGLCIFIAITFKLMHVFKPRPLGDPSYLSWNRNTPAGR